MVSEIVTFVRNNINAQDYIRTVIELVAIAYLQQLEIQLLNKIFPDHIQYQSLPSYFIALQLSFFLKRLCQPPCRRLKQGVPNAQITIPCEKSSEILGMYS